MKCIVKNCPDCLLDSWENEYKEIEQGYMCKRRKMHDCECQHVSVCFLKKLAEKCKSIQNEFTPDLLSDKYPDKYKFFKSGRADAGKEILSLLEIEEIKEC